MAIRLTDIHDLTTERLYISSHDTGGSVKAILSQDSTTFVRFTSLNVLPGYLLMGKLLEVINKYQINVVSMASSNVSISMMLTASSDTLRIVQRELHKYAEMVIDENMSVIHIIGSLHWKRTQVETSLSTHCPDNSSATSAQPDPKKIPGSRFIHSPAFFLFTFIHTY